MANTYELRMQMSDGSKRSAQFTVPTPTAEEVGARPADWMPSATDVGAAPASHDHDASAIKTGTLPVERGGTGAASVRDIIAKLFNSLDDSPTYIPSFDSNYENGGYTTPLRLRKAMGLGDTTGALPIENGGTGATTIAGILSNLGITASIAELNYVDGATANIQTQLDGKIPAVTNYYSSAKNADDLDVPLAMIPVSDTSNAGLCRALGSTSFAYVLTLFFSKMDKTANRVQLGFSYNAANTSMAMRRYLNGSWTEWVSVAGTRLEMGKEYLTAELYDNKPVYTMLFNGGTISDGAEIDYPGIPAESISIVRANCTLGKVPLAQRPAGVWAASQATSNYFACYYVAKNAITVNCGSSASGDVYVQIWYTKN